MLRDAALQGAKVPALVADNAALVDALTELANLMDGVRDGSYTPDSFTLQITRRVLAQEHPGATILEAHQRELSALQARVAELERERDEHAGQHERQLEGARQAVAAVRELQARAESERDGLRAQVEALKAKCDEAARALFVGGPADVEKAHNAVEDALSAPLAETMPAPSSPAAPDGSPALIPKEGASAQPYRMLSALDMRPTVPPLLPLSERIQHCLAKVGHEPTPLTTAAADSLHPSRRCTCAREGTCTWCRARCDACGSPHVPEAVRHAIAQVWSALHVTTAHQGVAVAVLRAVYPELPVPNARAGADSLLAWNALAEAVTEAARLGAEDMRERAASLQETAPTPASFFDDWPGTKSELVAHFARALAVRIRDLPLPVAEVPRG
ncbi:hypothetical protein [Corallococcus sp. EGB]|uniref:hypothetical protein n=1 Tax=Corallococcus sp. EGB TaxID=1521117 RepID=UPI001CBE3228|nr:hypothetical protein [Corallococcus sp. EGB]